MPSERKRIPQLIGIVLLALIFLGGPVFFLYLLGSLGMFPLYVTKVIPWLGICAVLAVILLSSGYLGSRGKKALTCSFLCVCLVSVLYIGYGFYKESLPSLDDRDLLLWQYQPFEEGSKAVTLDEKATFQLDQASALRLDGATALYPVYAGFVQAVWPEGEYHYYDSTISCYGTVAAYERLIGHEVDIIFAAAPSEAQLAAAKAAGMELHLTPIGREAFVFFVNNKNSVTNLTVEQIQGIYSGQITNWNEVGGKNQRIRPFQRAENSGSQTALQRLMDGRDLMEPETEDRIAGMGGIIEQVASYRNYKNAIGFSFRYYSTEMVQNGDIRLLALNGVEPTRETIRDGSYPISSEFYAVTAAPIGEPAPQERNQNMAAFLDWILSEQGQEIVERTGYVGVM